MFCLIQDEFSNHEYHRSIRRTPQTPPSFDKAEFYACSAIGDAEDPIVNSYGDSGVFEGIFDEALVEEIGLAKFLERPVKIHTLAWAVGSPLSYDIEPWYTYFDVDIFKEKMNHYNLIKCDFKITVYTKGTKFHAGLLMVSCRRTGNNMISVSTADLELVGLSQRPHVDIEVGTCQTGEITVPFIYPSNWVQTGGDTEETPALDKVKVSIRSYGALAGAGTTDNVSVTIFMQAVNVKLAAPTANVVGVDGDADFDPLHFFACDEYSNNGPISGVASAVASFAGKLDKIPVIGRYARATSMFASSIAGVATLFGFSKPPLIENLSLMRPTPLTNMALVEGGDCSQKMSLTAKQELSIDPGTVGLPGTDEMSFDYIKGIYSYVTNFAWAVDDAVDDIIFQCHVDPTIGRRTTETQGYSIVPTALSFLSRPFQAWSGSLTYRLQVIGTAFHTGKIAIFYEPYVLDPSADASADYNTNFHFVLDLAESRDLSFTITWKQGTPFRMIDGDAVFPDSWYFSADSTVNRDASQQSWSNGVWYVRILNELTVADGTTPVQIVMKVKAGDDFMLMDPCASQIQNFSLFPYVAADGISEYDPLGFFACSENAAPVGDFATEDVKLVTLVKDDCSIMCEKPMFFYGERAVSIRQLIKRFCYYRTLTPPAAATATSSDYFNFTQFPLFYGTDPQGVDVVSATQEYNYVGTTYLNYFAPAFGLWRGSVRYKLFTSFGTSYGYLASRTPTANVKASFLPVSFATTATTQPMNLLYRSELVHSINGSAFTTSAAPLEFEVPYQERLKASWVKPSHNQNSSFTDLTEGRPSGSQFKITNFRSGANGNAVVFAAAGDDMSLMCFNGAPVMYYYNLG